MTGLTLFAIEETLAALIDTVDLVNPDEEAQFALDFQAALKTAVEKRDRVGQFLAHLESQMALADAEVKRLRDRKAALGSVLERVEGYVQQTIEAGGFDDDGRYRKLEGNTVSFSLRACPPSVDITDADALPDQYKLFTIQLPAELWARIADVLTPALLKQLQEHLGRADVSIDKRAIKKDIDLGWEIPGADLAIGRYSLCRR